MWVVDVWETWVVLDSGPSTIALLIRFPDCNLGKNCGHLDLKHPSRLMNIAYRGTEADNRAPSMSLSYHLPRP